MLALPGALVGACVGSFAATASLRYGEGRSALWGRSSCDHCGVALGFAETVPLISYVGLRGACASCGERIGPLHLVGEVAGAAIVGVSFALLPLQQAGLAALMGLALLGASLTDVAVRRLPDSLTAAIALCALALAAGHGAPAVLEGVVAGVVAFALLAVLRRAYRSVRGRDGLGFGDVKLLAALALWLGSATPWALCLAAAGGLIAASIQPTRGGLAFGPFIAVSGWVVGVLMEAVP